MKIQYIRLLVNFGNLKTQRWTSFFLLRRWYCLASRLHPVPVPTAKLVSAQLSPASAFSIPLAYNDFCWGTWVTFFVRFQLWSAARVLSFAHTAAPEKRLTFRLKLNSYGCKWTKPGPLLYTMISAFARTAACSSATSIMALKFKLQLEIKKHNIWKKKCNYMWRNTIILSKTGRSGKSMGPVGTWHRWLDAGAFEHPTFATSSSFA